MNEKGAWKRTRNIQRDGDIEGEQVGDAYSVRFQHTSRRDPYAFVTAYAYPVVSEDNQYCVELQFECIACRDPNDPGSTEVWCDREYLEGGELFSRLSAAERAARRHVEELDGDDIASGWDGTPG